MDGLVGDPVDILDLGPFWSGAEGSRIGSALVRIPEPETNHYIIITLRPSFYSYFSRPSLFIVYFTTYPVRAKFVR